MDDSFQLLKMTTNMSMDLQNEEFIKLKNHCQQVQKELELFKNELTKVVLQNQKLKQSLESAHKSTIQTLKKQEHTQKELFEMQSSRTKQRSTHLALIKAHLQQIQTYKQKIQGKNNQISHMVLKLKQQEQTFAQHVSLKQSVVQIMTKTQSISEKEFKKLEQMQNMMKKQVELNSVISSQTQLISKLQLELKNAKGRNIRMQISMSQEIQNKAKQIEALHEVIKKYRQSRGKIRQVYELQDTIKREYDELKKITDKSLLTNKKDTIDKKLYKILKVFGDEVMKQVLIKI